MTTPEKKKSGVVGWCVPNAIACLTGMSMEKAWLEVLADRHERGRPLLMLPGRLSAPHGGGHAAEAIRVIERAGFDLDDAWSGTRRMKFAEFLRFADQSERERGPAPWLIMQQMHLAHLPAQWTWREHGSLMPGLPIAKAWRVYRRLPAVAPTLNLAPDDAASRFSQWANNDPWPDIEWSGDTGEPLAGVAGQDDLPF